MHLPRLGGSWRYWSYANMDPAEGQPVEAWAPASLLNLVQEQASLRGSLTVPGGEELALQGSVTPAHADDPSRPPGPRASVVNLVGIGGEARYLLRGVLAPNQDQIVGLVTTPGPDAGGRPPGSRGLFLMVRA